MNVYKHRDYRKILSEALEASKKDGQKVSQRALSEAMKIQKSYLSGVLNRRAELSHDQLYMACEYLEFNAEERSYVFLCLEASRSGIKRRRDELLAQIKSIQSLKLETKEHLAAPSVDESEVWQREYFLEPWHQIIHVSLLAKPYRDDLNMLAKDLGIPHQRVEQIVSSLEKMQILQREKSGNITIKIKSFHLPRESPIYAAWRNMLKQLAAQRLQALPKESAYSFSATFGASPQTYDKLRLRILEFLKEIESEVAGVPAEQTFQLSIDLFPWTLPEVQSK